MAGIRNRLRRLEEAISGAWFAPLGLLLLGAAAGGAVAGIPLFGSSDAKLKSWVEPVYWSAIGVCVFVGLLCLLAHRAVGEQRADSIAAIREDCDELLKRYEEGS
jgi:hypothetical protein